ncbi:hypothetical protein PG996_007957 [Apiospora saccharicola]|uniref:Methyltransferase type 12 domain-containing protein n=1 Tax=Apiospora saccharicola TaxID=335842 RepID=A0ABR1UZ06_9PEZI
MTSNPPSGAKVDKVRQDYDEQASMYNVLLQWPFGQLESQLFASAVGRDDFCRGATVLDLGGGTGLRARQALEAGAARVDVVDFSDEMMAVGRRDGEALLGDSESARRLRWFHGDATKPLFGGGSYCTAETGRGRKEGAGTVGVPGLSPPYDVVMANWVFDHVDKPEVLEAIWQNIAAAVGPGGRFVGVRACDPRCEAMISGRYGPTCQDFAEFPKGLYYSSTIPSTGEGQPAIHLENASLEVSYSGSTEMHERHGFGDVEIEPCGELDVVRADPDFWQAWIDQPGFVVVKARKK